MNKRTIVFVLLVLFSTLFWAIVIYMGRSMGTTLWCESININLGGYASISLDDTHVNHNSYPPIDFRSYRLMGTAKRLVPVT